MARGFGIGCALLVALLLAFLASGWSSLDRDLRHSAAVAALPEFNLDAFQGGAAIMPTPQRVRISARDLEFHGRVAGFSKDGAPVLMLHGFPESSRMWEPLLEASAQAGYRAAAFDQRGYSPGARFEQTESYRIAELEADVLAVADALGFDRFHLVGHDWGAIVGWGVVASHPERILSWTALSIPHPSGLREANEGKGTPLYVRLFRVPGLMEAIFSFRDFAFLDGMMSEIPVEQVEAYRRLFSEPGAMTAALDWYRALEFRRGAEVGPVSSPVLYLFGNKDMPVYVGAEPRAAQAKWLLGPNRSIEFEAGHWLMEEKTDAVVAAILEHMAAVTR